MAVRELEQMAGIKVPDQRNRISLFHAAVQIDCRHLQAVSRAVPTVYIEH